MKFNRTDLIDRAEAEIQRRKDAAAEADAQAAKDAVTQRQEWLDTKGPGYVLFANRIKDKIRKGRPIVQDDIPQEIRTRYDRIDVFSDPRRTTTTPEVAHLERFISVLSAVTDDEVTSTGLVQLGYRDLTKLFR